MNKRRSGVVMHVETRRPKYDPLLATCVLVPVAGLIALYSFALRARFALGTWPSPYRPDPTDLGFPIHQGVVRLSLESALASPVALVLCLMVHRTTALRGRRMALSVVLYVTAYAALWALLVMDPGSIFEWYTD